MAVFAAATDLEKLKDSSTTQIKTNKNEQTCQH